MCICRLTLAWISSENSTTHEECCLILTCLGSLLLDPLSCRLVTSAVRCRLATRVTLCQLTSLSSFVQLLSRSLTHFRSRRDRKLRLLFDFAPKQTKGSSAWWTTYIVLHLLAMSVSVLFGICVFKWICLKSIYIWCSRIGWELFVLNMVI